MKKTKLHPAVIVLVIVMIVLSFTNLLNLQIYIKYLSLFMLHIKLISLN